MKIGDKVKVVNSKSIINDNLIHFIWIEWVIIRIYKARTYPYAVEFKRLWREQFSLKEITKSNAFKFIS